jgi:hypothetical protein
LPSLDDPSSRKIPKDENSRRPSNRDSYSTYIMKAVYDVMIDEVKVTNGTNMWDSRSTPIGLV